MSSRGENQQTRTADEGEEERRNARDNICQMVVEVAALSVANPLDQWAVFVRGVLDELHFNYGTACKFAEPYNNADVKALQMASLLQR